MTILLQPQGQRRKAKKPAPVLLKKPVTIEARVVDIISRVLLIDEIEIGMSTRLIEDLGADFLDLTEIVMEIEEEFEVTITDSAAESAALVSDLVRLASTVPPTNKK